MNMIFVHKFGFIFIYSLPLFSDYWVSWVSNFVPNLGPTFRFEISIQQMVPRYQLVFISHFY